MKTRYSIAAAAFLFGVVECSLVIGAPRRRPPASGEALTATINKVNNQNNGSFIAGGVIPTVTFNVTGARPGQATYVQYSVSDENSVSIKTVQIPITIDGSGNAVTPPTAMPAVKKGYYRVDASLQDGTILYPTGKTIGTRPPGFITYAVFNDPDTRFKYASNLTRFGVEDPMNSTQLSSTLSYLGVRWVGYLQQQWAVLEPNGPNTFNGTIPISYWNTTASVTPTGAPWTTYNVFYYTATHTPLWAQLAGTCGIYDNMCALNASGVANLPNFASRFAAAAKAQWPNQERYYQITWESWPPYGFGGSTAQLLQYYQLAYPAIHAADPQAIVVGPTMFPGSQSILKLLNSAGTPPWSAVVDGLSEHPYEAPGWPPEVNNGPFGHTYPSSPDNIVYPNLSFVNSIKNQQDIMTAFKGHPVPMIGTEQGYSSEDIANIPSFDPNNRSQVDLGLLEQAQGNVRQTLIWLGQGGAFDTLFTIADLWYSSPSAERVNLWGAYFNLDPAHAIFGSTFLGPKPTAPAYSAMTWALDGFDHSNGPIPGLTGTQRGYSFVRTVNNPQTVWAVWDYAATSTATVPVPAGPYKLCDWMSNCTSLTSNGSVQASVGGNPIYIMQ